MSQPGHVTWLWDHQSFFQKIVITLLSLILALGVLFCVSRISFIMKLRNCSGLPPTVPSAIPYLGYTWIFASGDTRMASVFLASMFGQLFGAPKAVCEATEADDSGTATKPYPGSHIHPGRRIIRNQVLFFNDAFSKKSMDEMIPRFIQNLYQRCESFAIGEQWVEMDDLFEFIHDLTFPVAVVSFFGASMLNMNPNLQRDFRSSEDSVPFLAAGLPSWLNPQAFHARERCLEAVKRWRREAVKKEDSNVPDDQAWDPAWGLGALRRRNKLYETTDSLFDDEARAASDLATAWASTTNVIPASFWFLFEILSTSGLRERAEREVKASKTASGTIDTTKLIDSALLSSIYAEVLRLHSSALITRTSKQEHKLGDWILPKDQAVMISTHVEHRSSYWDAVEEQSGAHHTPTSFYAERFVTRDASGRDAFSMDGKQGRWMPYGMGEHMCPGRHFAKYEMLLIFAVLVQVFEIELLTTEGWKPDDDLKRYWFGALRPKQKEKFRIQKRAASSSELQFL
ncbi:cytochrome P450 [Byssothecium circinans]|uniref:Cytochrome P450 n=1 Tax=Byssothecium circinans TaxID=147558 RepID=A0A6A5TA35_9PLEO|nr:cytochrome P450 [Byssothecium circinans]